VTQAGCGCHRTAVRPMTAVSVSAAMLISRRHSGPNYCAARNRRLYAMMLFIAWNAYTNTVYS